MLGNIARAGVRSVLRQEAKQGQAGNPNTKPKKMMQEGPPRTVRTPDIALTALSTPPRTCTAHTHRAPGLVHASPEHPPRTRYRACSPCPRTRYRAPPLVHASPAHRTANIALHALRAAPACDPISRSPPCPRLPDNPTPEGFSGKQSTG